MPVLSDHAVDLLTQAWALCMLREDFAPVAVDAAVDALVAGIDNAPIPELAGLPLPANPFEAKDLLRRTTEVMDIDYSHMSESDACAVVLRRRVLDFRAGAMSLRELTSWARRLIGHDRTPETEDIVLLDDDLDLVEAGVKAAVDSESVIQQFLDATSGYSNRWRAGS